MRAADRELTDQVMVRAFLERAEVGRLAMVDGTSPYVVPMNFVYEPTAEVFYFHCADEGHKIDCLGKNPNVCVEVDEFISTIGGKAPCSHDTAYTSAIAWGTVAMVSDRSEQYKALALLTEKYAGPEMAAALTEKMSNEYKSAEGSKTIVLRVDVQEMSVKHSGID